MTYDKLKAICLG